MRQFSRVSRVRENRGCPQPKEREKSHGQSVRRVIWLRESNTRIVKLPRSGEAAVGDCSVKLQREADRSGPSMRKPTARPEAAARQTASDCLS